MLEGIDVKKRIEFTSSKDTTEPKTIFVLKPVSCIDAISEPKHENPIVNACLNSIEEVKNFNGATNIIDIINSLDSDTFTELLVKINEINGLTEDSKKK
jgi:hypothetical protein